MEIYKGCMGLYKVRYVYLYRYFYSKDIYMRLNMYTTTYASLYNFTMNCGYFHYLNYETNGNMFNFISMILLSKIIFLALHFLSQSKLT